jgi:Extensin-like protein C-terminus
MTRGVRLYLVGSLVLVALAGCGRFFFAEREPWRREAEVQCLKSGAVKEGAAIVRADAINGPGICGADFPLKVAALGDSGVFGYADELRPPAPIPNAAPRWPLGEPRYAPPPEPRYEPRYTPPPDARHTPPPGPRYEPRDVPPLHRAPTNGPISLNPPNLPDARGPPTYSPRTPTYNAPSRGPTYESRPYPPPAAPRAYPDRPDYATPGSYPPSAPQTVPLGPSRAPLVTGSTGPAIVKPAATLACPMVSALEQWVTGAVQPAANRWFRQPVVEIKQISAYSCRGMNGQPGARISEHAFGNALDIAAFTLADGRTITIKDGWRGLPEEQGFLRDIQAAACEQFNTVLAPGSNRFHYDHMHVDLMRRTSGHRICNPDAVSGDEVAARAAQRRYVRQDERGVTGSLPPRRQPRRQAVQDDDDWIEDDPYGR